MNNNKLSSKLNKVYILGNLLLSNNILDFNTNLLAETGGIVTGQLYRTGGILKIKVDS